MSNDRLDLTSNPNLTPHKSESESSRPFLGVTFACCGAYARVYVNRAGTAYEGRCPRCAKPVRFPIGPDGSDARFFTAY
jgi:hypothetical protein